MIARFRAAIASFSFGVVATLAAAMLLSVAMLSAWPLHAEVPVPPLKTRVTDLTATLNAQQRAALEQKLAAFEAKKGSQVAVLLVPTTQPEAIEQYAIRVFDQWKLGRKGVDDGVLLLVAKNDRKLRIEVGRGLEGAIPDAVAKRIIEEQITPRFKQGDFHGGITAGTDRLIRLIEGEPMPPPKQSRSPGAEWGAGALYVGLLVLVIAGSVLRAIFGRLLGAGIVSFAAGAVGFLLGGLLGALVLGVIAFIITLATAVGSRSGRGWSSSDSWSSGGSSWSASDSGFSGGGGDSGGGGASGSW